jgi:crotonobetainyl-CoA:carnitine CoA-transferase CaiB-like acyl-CoA transferase
MGALTGIKVLDLSRVLAGPYATQMLGDMGADIIKIEKPFAGDDTRQWGPPFLEGTKESAYYLSINRNKKSVAIDITTQAGQKIIHDLLHDTDILIENFKVGSLEKYGLDYASLKDKYPRLIYASITGFGQNGSLSTEPGYDLVAQAMGGLMSVTGEPNGAPMKAGVALSDILTGLHVTVGILAALQSRHTTNKGQMIDVSLLDSTLASMTNLAQYYLTSHTVVKRYGNEHSTIVPYQAFEASDGWLVLAVGNDKQFQKLCALLKHDEWSDDDRFKTNPARVLNRDILIPLLSDAIKQFTVSDFVDACRAVDIPAGPVQNMAQIFASDQITAREMKISMDHVSGQPTDLVGSPLKFSETPVSYQCAPPICGQDTISVLQKLGYTNQTIENLVTQNIIEAVR